MNERGFNAALITSWVAFITAAITIIVGVVTAGQESSAQTLGAIAAILIGGIILGYNVIPAIRCFSSRLSEGGTGADTNRPE